MELGITIGVACILLILAGIKLMKTEGQVTTLKDEVKKLEHDLHWARNDRDNHQADLAKLEEERSTAWKRLKDEAKERAENNLAYDLRRAKETEENLICANKDLQDVIAEMRNLFAKTQQQSASDTVKALVPWNKEGIDG